MNVAEQNCDDLLFSVGWKTDDTLYADTIMLPVKERAFETTKATLAVFKDTNEVGIQEFYGLFTLLAEDLMASPEKSIMLVGHVSPDVKRNQVKRGLTRAGYVKEFMVAYGVNPAQIKVRSEGARKPHYYLTA